MKQKSSLLLCLGLLLPGCVVVPKTEISYSPGSRSWKLASPKDVTIGYLLATYTTTGGVSLVISNYSSKNNLEVLQAITAANSATAKEGATLLGTVVGAMK